MVENLAANMASLEWWFSVVVVGLVVGVLGNFATRVVDRMFGGGIKWLHKFSKAREDDWNKRMLYLAGNDEKLREAKRREIRDRLRAIQFSLLAFFLAAPGYLSAIDVANYAPWAVTLSNALTIVTMLIAVSSYNDAEKSSNLTESAIVMQDLMKNPEKKKPEIKRSSKDGSSSPSP